MIPALGGFLVRTVLLTMTSHGFSLVHGERRKGNDEKENDLKYLFIFHKDMNPTISGFFTPQDHIPNPITYKDFISKYHQCLGLQAALYKRRSITNNYSKAVTKMNSVH